MGISAMDPTDIAILIVQGSFQTPLVYKLLSDGLEARGYSTSHPGLPSCSNTENPDFPSKTLIDDTEAVRNAVKHLVEHEKKTIVVVMHSYGGLVGSNAIDEELNIAHRRSAGLAGGVLHLFYFAAFVLDKQQSVIGKFGESRNNDVRVSLQDLSVWRYLQWNRKMEDSTSRTVHHYFTMTSRTKKLHNGDLG